MMLGALKRADWSQAKNASCASQDSKDGRQADIDLMPHAVT